jgi:hypothetical protein
MRALRAAAVIVPVLVAARPLGSDELGAPARPPVPLPNAVDLWLGQADGVDLGTAEARESVRRLLAQPLSRAAAPSTAEAQGFGVVGSVAVLEGDDTTVTRVGTGYGINYGNLAAASRRFIAAFGDDYDQIAVFLGFADRLQQQSLAYQQPVRNDAKGIGLDLFDATESFGSKGRMQTVLNMKRISVYGREAADDPDNGLYAVWAQEAAHRWLVYLNYKREGDDKPSDALRGRQKAHWARTVQTDASILDGIAWKDNGDGTFTPGERGKRYSALDQYAMGLRQASEVPPFYFLEDLKDQDGREVMMSALQRGGRYTAKRVDLTINDIIRAMGKREPATDAAAADLRMGVLLLAPPGVAPGDFAGEAFRIDATRRLWIEFYNAAGGGRGRVCTELLHPCGGDAYTFTDPQLAEAPSLPGADGVPAPGEAVTLKVTVTNVGSVAGKAKARVEGHGQIFFAPDTLESPLLAPGASAPMSFQGRVAAGAACAEVVSAEVSAPGARGASRSTLALALGMRQARLDSLEDGAAGWKVNPDGKDTGEAGRWALGTPPRSVAFDYVLQPGAAYSGGHAFVTGLGPEQTDNVEGRTTLESPPFALGELREPQLSYQVYFVSADFQDEVLIPSAAGSLRVEASIDGGPWVEVDRAQGLATGWQRRIVPLAPALSAPAGAKADAGAMASAEDAAPADAVVAASADAAPGLAVDATAPTSSDDAGVKAGPDAAPAATAGVRFRFIAEEKPSSAKPVVEAVIDDIGLFGQAASCIERPDGGDEPPGVDGAADGGKRRTEPGGCGCRLAGGASRGTGTWVGLVLGLALALTRARLARGARNRRP